MPKLKQTVRTASPKAKPRAPKNSKPELTAAKKPEVVPSTPQPVVSLLDQIIEAHQAESTPRSELAPETPAEPVRHFNFDDAPDTIEGLQLENAQLRQVIRDLETEVALYKANVRAPKKAGGNPVSIDRSEAAKKSWDKIRANRAAKLAQQSNASAAD